MAFDGTCLHFLIGELREQLLDTRVEKIYQTTKDEFLFVLKGASGRGGRLIFSTNASCARVGLTAQEITNPKEPPGFCMLLRKKLRSARLTRIDQAGLDRIVIFTFDGRDEMGDEVSYRLIAELMGRYSNLILTDSGGMILNSSKHVDLLMSAKRQILPHLQYCLPPTQKKLNPLVTAPEEMAEAVAGERGKTLDRAILSALEGFSPAAARELALLAEPAGQTGSMTPQLQRNLTEVLASYQKFLAGKGEPCLFYNADNLPAELSFMPLRQYQGSYTLRRFDDFSSLLEAFYGEKSRGERIRQRASDLLQWVHGAIARTEKKLALQAEELDACKDREENRIRGDLITASIYKMKKGDRVLEAEDYYHGGVMKTIPLDAQLTPSQNAQRYYKKYRKSVNAERTLTEQIALGREELDYLSTVQEALQRAESEDELAEIRQELTGTGYLRHQTKKAKIKPLKPRMFRSSDGFLILVGRNNLQNDRLTLKQSSKQDLWFHTKDIPGAHTVLVTEGKEVPERSLLEAAELAAYHSRGKGSSGVPVDYCPIRNVKKPAGAKPGKVIYDTYKTLYVTPDGEKAVSLAEESGR